MAYRVFPLYNLNASVGKGGTNSPDDVKVVQGLLNIIFSDLRSKSKMEDAAKTLGLTLGKPPETNGISDENLLNYIMLFQSYSSSLAQDGRIDPVPAAAFDITAATKSGKQYQLYMLNKTALFVGMTAFMKLGDKIGVGYFAKLDGVDFYY